MPTDFRTWRRRARAALGAPRNTPPRQAAGGPAGNGPRNAALRTWFRRAGAALAVLGAAWVAVRLGRDGGALAPAEVPGFVWSCAAGLAVVYAGADILLALAWQALLQGQGTHAGRAWCIRTYGVSQLAKYLPGNVMHFASRQFLGASAGVTHAVLARSSLYELAGLAAAGFLLSLLALPLIADGGPPRAAPLAGAAVIALAAAAVRRAAGPAAARVLCLHLLFLFVASLIFAALLALLAPGTAALPWPAVCGAYAAAWLAGFLTPGAPAGLGVREAVLVLLLGGLAAEQEVLPAVVLSRAVTALGDTIFFGAAAWAGRRARTPD